MIIYMFVCDQESCVVELRLTIYPFPDEHETVQLPNIVIAMIEVKYS